MNMRHRLTCNYIRSIQPNSTSGHVSPDVLTASVLGVGTNVLDEDFGKRGTGRLIVSDNGLGHATSSETPVIPFQTL
jgi:hypothetical protein